MVVMVKYDIRGVCRAFPTHTQEHFWDTKQHFYGLRICGSLAPKKLTADAQNCRIAARINGNLGHPNEIKIHSLCVGWRNFFPVVLLCQFLVLAGNRFWFYILAFLEYNTVVALC